MSIFLKLQYLVPNRRRVVEEDMREELQSLASLSEAEGKRSELGSLALVAEEGRSVWVWTWLEQLAADIRYACRAMRRNPGLTLIAVLSLALGMDGFMERHAKGFSQGQRIKVALARALVHDPGNVVLDEPTNGLDVMAIRNLREMLMALKAQGRCVLFSSHVMQEVAALCDRVVIIGHGRVLADATVQEIRERSGTATLEEAFLQVLGDTEGVS